MVVYHDVQCGYRCKIVIDDNKNGSGACVKTMELVSMIFLCVILFENVLAQPMPHVIPGDQDSLAAPQQNNSQHCRTQKCYTHQLVSARGNRHEISVYILNDVSLNTGLHIHVYSTYCGKNILGDKCHHHKYFSSSMLRIINVKCTIPNYIDP
ncbi:hypothetical protein KSF78_0005640 [Schistosoma japonicum]|nr:hypothetical protein KSF78_0005640 [Schistosoma japonicum]